MNKELYKVLRESFKNNEWEYDSNYVIKHKTNKLLLWVGNGSIFFNFYESSLNIPFLYRFPLWRHYKKMQSHAILIKFTGGKTK